jgi:hypothetical protein
VPTAVPHRPPVPPGQADEVAVEGRALLAFLHPADEHVVEGL